MTTKSEKILIAEALSKSQPVMIRLHRVTAGIEHGVNVDHVREHDGYSVTFRESSGTLNGRRFRTLEEAEALFATWTSEEE